MVNSKRAVILLISQTLMLTIVQYSCGMEQAFVQQIKEKIETSQAEKAALLKWKQEKIDQLTALRIQRLEGSREYQHIALLSEMADQKTRTLDETTREREQFLFFLEKHGFKEPRLIATIQHKGFVHAVAWSPDGSKIATTSYDRTAQVWDIINNKLITTIEHQGSVRTVAWSPDGSKIATGSLDSTAKIWDIINNNLITTIRHKGCVHAVAWSPDGSKIATASSDNTAQVWDIANEKLITTIRHKGFVYAVAWSPDGSKLATCSSD